MTHSSSDLKHFALQIQQVRFSNLKEPCLWVAIMATQSTESSFLVGLVGTEIVTEVKPELQLPTKTWVTSERIEELSLVVTQQAIDLGYKPGFAAAKFFCYSKDNPSQETAFMRVYRQIPLSGTEWTPSCTRAAQALPQAKIRELIAYKTLQSQACPVVPQLLGYQEELQGDDGLVPGGSSITIVWQKVPGFSLSREYFWNLDFDHREAIREEFRHAYD
ncbi:hypothetical protein POX_a00452 [Penicillium oxalicum]|uniref:hypothetical protein n=1 Tax=Penicillium oxalicum TaxID=69781 RepID=UPI0020B81543|nr:hypothetical protein POX_a00452 [Penicillium oxalicum]KAI2793865.1 hypothetical protein POX_a00452 [Penicillium oxalicum]